MNGESLASRMWEANVRVGAVIHVLGATADIEGPSGVFTTFIEDAAHEPWVVSWFKPVWPRYEARMKDLVEEFDEERKEDRRSAEALYREGVAEFFRRDCPKAFVVQIEHQVQRCISADAKFPFGTWVSGWGHTQSVRLLADTVEEAIEVGIGIADEQRRAAWGEAKKAGKKKAAKKSAAKAGAL